MWPLWGREVKANFLILFHSTCESPHRAPPLHHSHLTPTDLLCQVFFCDREFQEASKSFPDSPLKSLWIGFSGPEGKLRRPLGMRWGERVSGLGGPERKSHRPKATEAGCGWATEQREAARRWRGQRCWESGVNIWGFYRSPSKEGRAVCGEWSIWTKGDLPSPTQYSNQTLCGRLNMARVLALPPSDIDSISAVLESGLFLWLALTRRE